MRRVVQILTLSVLALFVAYPPGRAASDPSSPSKTVEAVPQASLSNVQTLQIRGGVTWQISGNTLSFHAASIANLGSSPATVALTLMASNQPPRYGDDLSQARVLARHVVGSVQGGSQANDIDSGTVSYARPAPGTYYIFVTADVLQGGTYVYQDIFTFPNTEAFGATCTQDALTMCLNGGRFSVKSTWTVPSQGTSGVGSALPLVGGDTGYFWFFSSNAAELMVKMVDGRTVNGSFWVFYGALSNVQYTITVTDTLSGQVKTYQNPNGNLASVADVTAFVDSSGTEFLSGTWTGVFNTTDPHCSAVSGAIGTGTFAQSGADFTGSFLLPGNSSGGFQGSIIGNQVSGLFTTTTPAGCSGSGNFTGTLSGNTLTVHAPTVTTAQQGCVFCQNNTIILTKTAS